MVRLLLPKKRQVRHGKGKGWAEGSRWLCLFAAAQAAAPAAAAYPHHHQCCAGWGVLTSNSLHTLPIFKRGYMLVHISTDIYIYAVLAS